MPERIVSDVERVNKIISLWWSRFNKGPSAAEIARVTGLSHERVQSALSELSQP